MSGGVQEDLEPFSESSLNARKEGNMKGLKIASRKTRRAAIPLVVTWVFIFTVLLGMPNPPLQAQEKEWRIGVTGAYKMEAGPGVLKGAEMAANEINAKGGVLGKQIKLFYADTETLPEKGITALKRLVERDKVQAIVGGTVSGVVLAQMEYLSQYKTVYMVSGASSPMIAEKVEKNYDKYKYQFRVTFNAKALADAILQEEIGYFIKLGYKKFALLVEDAAWNRGLPELLSAEIPKLGGTVTTVVKFDTNTLDFAPIFSRITGSGADFSINLVALSDTITLFKQWYEMKAPFRMGGFDNPGMIAEYWKRTGGACLSAVNIFAGASIRAAKTPRTIPWFDQYVKTYNHAPHSDASSTYDAVYLAADAAQRAKSLEAEAIIKALEATDYIGIQGRYVFDKKTHDTKNGPDFVPFLVTQWQDGEKWVVLHPEKFATGKFINPPWLK
jgi:branched-chain amino acid transport system substrate-binding protein